MVHLLGSFWRNERGGIAVVTALAIPVLMGVTAASVEYGTLSNRRSELQLAADSGSMAGVNQFKLANTEDTTAIDTAIRVVKFQAGSGVPAGREIQVAAEVLNKHTAVHVTVTETVPLTFGHLLNMPETVLKVESTAKLTGTTRLCLLALDSIAIGAFNLESSARITATDCSLYSNSLSPAGIQAKDAAVASALMTCTAGGFVGFGASFIPAPLTGCPSLKDPLIGKAAPPIGSCIVLGAWADPKNARLDSKPAYGANVVSGAVSLDPGTYCGGLHLTEAALVTLRPGIYIMKDGPLVVDKKSSVTGENVGFYFSGTSGGMLFDTKSVISLTAPKAGDMAGLLFFEDRDTSKIAVLPLPLSGKGGAPKLLGLTTPLREYRIISESARTLLGTIYVPVGRLVIDSTTAVADLSAYTVIVARLINLYDGPNLMLNARYGSTDIPVPKGVGPSSGYTSLSN